MDEIVAWLASLGLGEYGPQFVENRVGPDVLSELTDQDLKELGVHALGDRRKLLRAIADRSEALAATPRTPMPEMTSAITPLPTEMPAPARLPVAAERRQLTVMFCDLVGG